MSFFHHKSVNALRLYNWFVLSWFTQAPKEVSGSISTQLMQQTLQNCTEFFQKMNGFTAPSSKVADQICHTVQELNDEALLQEVCSIMDEQYQKRMVTDKAFLKRIEEGRVVLCQTLAERQNELILGTNESVLKVVAALKEVLKNKH